MSEAFKAGTQAFKDGKKIAENPYNNGFTKLGNVRFSDFEAGSDWDNGFRSMQPDRVANQKEIQAAQSVDVSRFRKKSNRYYK